MYIFQATEDFKKEVFLISRWLWFEQGGGRGLEALLSLLQAWPGSWACLEVTVLWCAGWWPSCKGASATGSALPLRAPPLLLPGQSSPHLPS